MQNALTYVVFGTVAFSVVISLVMLTTRGGGGSVYDQIGQGGLSMDERPSHGGFEPAPDSPVAQAEREQEIRQMLRARNERQVRQGAEPVDIDAELARLTDPQTGADTPGTQAGDTDAGLSIEVRQLVVARNERRVRQGQEPLDVEAEVQRTLRELSA
jgi:hypothetical protein